MLKAPFFIILILFVFVVPVMAQGTLHQNESFKVSLPLGRAYDLNHIRVLRVIDGDTLMLENGERVVLVGIDAPENRTSGKARSDSRKEGQPLRVTKIQGRRAAKFVSDLVTGQPVHVEFDVEKKDPDGRWLGYVWMPVPSDIRPKNPAHPEYPDDWVVQERRDFCRDCPHPFYVFLNATILKAGYAYAESTPPNEKYADLFQKLFKEAHTQKRGLWEDRTEGDSPSE